MGSGELKQDLVNRLNDLVQLHKHPKLFISEYYYSIRNDVDIEAERLLMLASSSLNPEQINRIRGLMIDTLKRSEIECYQAAEDRDSSGTTNDLIAATLEQFTDRINQLDNDEKHLGITDVAKQVNTDNEDKYLGVLTDLMKEIESFRRALLLGNTIFFLEREKNGFGVLVTFEDIYLNELELSSLKKLSLKSSSFYITEAFEASENFVAEKSLIKPKVFRVLNKNLFLIWYFEDYLTRRISDVSLTDLNIDEFNYILKINQDVVYQKSTTQEETIKYFRNEEIELPACFINYVKEDAFKYFTDIYGIDLKSNLIQNLEPDTFKHLVHLQRLILTKNMLKEIHPNSFISLRGLVRLSLSENEINFIQPGTFSQLINLKVLCLSRNKIKSIERSTFKNLYNLQRLYLDGNDISEIGEDLFSHLINLQELFLSNNKIACLDQSIFRNLLCLQDLRLDRNALQVLHPMTFKSLEKLRELDLDGNELEYLDPSTFETQKNLRKLRLGRNRIERLNPGTFKSLTLLKRLSLAGNRLKSLHPETFESLEAIEELHLNDNQLETINTDMFKSFTKLESLYLFGNLLEETGLSDFSNL